MKPWKTISRRTILDLGRYLSVELHQIELPDGGRLVDWPWVKTPDYALVLPQTGSGDFLVFRQTKYAVEGLSLAPVGGYVENNEEPPEAARRELLEEMGYQAEEWIELGSYSVDGNRGCGRAHLFLARGARYIGEFDSDDTEEQKIISLSREALDAALRAGEFKLASWALVVALALGYESHFGASAHSTTSE